MKKNVVMTSTINVNIFYAHTFYTRTCTHTRTLYTHSYPVHVHVLPPQINMTESAINDALVAEVKRLEKEFDKEEAAFMEYRKVSEKNTETFNKLKLMHENEVKKRIELEVEVEFRDKEIKELEARLEKVISINIELKQFKENYLERKRKRKEKLLQNPPCPVKKRKKSFPDVPP